MENENRKKVLVVDDDQNLRKILVEKLKISGFDTESAPDGREGLDKALEWHPDLILLDILMPNISGWEMLKMLRGDEWGKNARVIMLTMVEDVDAIARAMQDGSFTYLIKTDHTMDSIIEKVQENLRSKHPI